MTINMANALSSKTFYLDIIMVARRTLCILTAALWIAFGLPTYCWADSVNPTISAANATEEASTAYLHCLGRAGCPCSDGGGDADGTGSGPGGDGAPGGGCGKCRAPGFPLIWLPPSSGNPSGGSSSGGGAGDGGDSGGAALGTCPTCCKEMQSDSGSYVDNTFYNYNHMGTDIRRVINSPMELTRYHRSRDFFIVGGFGPGVVNTFDMRLRLENDFQQQGQLHEWNDDYADFYDASYDLVGKSWASIAVPDSQTVLNFTYGTENTLVPQERQRAKNLQIFDDQMQPVGPTTDEFEYEVTLNFPGAKFAKVTNWDGSWFLFELFLGEANSQWDSATDHPTDGRIVQAQNVEGSGYTVAYRTWTTTEIQQSPSRQWQIQNVTDHLGNQLAFEYSTQQVSGHWLITKVTGPGSNEVLYRYKDKFLNEIEYSDGSISTFNYSVAANGGVKYEVHDFGAKPTHRHKTVILGGSAATVGGNVIPTAVGTARVVLNGENEVTYMTFAETIAENGEGRWMVYEGGGRVRAEVNYVQSSGGTYLAPERYLLDGWRFDWNGEASGSSYDAPSAVGVLEPQFARYQGDLAAVASGRPPVEIDLHGVKRVHTYDGLNNRIRTDYADNTFETWCYVSGTNWFLRHRDRKGHITRRTYDSIGRVLSEAVGLTDSSQNVGIIDQYGNTDYDRCAQDDVQTSEYAVTQWQYHSTGNGAGRLAKVIDPMGNETDLQYDASNRLIKTVFAASASGQPRPEMNRTYDSLGRLETITDPDGHEVQYVYDDNNRLISTIYDDGSTERVIYFTTGSQTGLIEKKIDRVGVVTTYQYDAADRLISEVSAAAMMSGESETPTPSDAQQIDYEYLDGTTSVDRISGDGQAETRYTYDYRGRRVRTTVASNAGNELVTRSTFQNNQLVGSEDPYGRETLYAYDASNARLIRTVSETVPESLALAARQNEWKPGFFDTLGNYIDDEGKIYRLQTNGNYIYTVPGEGDYPPTYTFTPTSVQYSGEYGDPNAPPPPVQNPDWGPFYDLEQAGPPPPAPSVALVSSSVDLLGLERPTGVNTLFTIQDTVYDAVGNAIERYDARLVKTGLEYDSRGRQTAMVSAVGTSVEARTETIYDLASNVIEVRSPRYFDSGDTAGHQKSKETWTYNGRNLVATHSEAPDASEAATESFAYDLLGRQTEKTDFAGKVWTAHYEDCCGQVIASENPLGHGSIVRKDSVGRAIHQVSVEDYSSHTSSLDNPVDAKTLREVTTKYDGRGRPVARTTWLVARGLVDATDPPIAGLGSVAAADGLTEQFLYDDDLTDGVGLDSSGGVTPLIGSTAVSLSAAITKLAATEANGGAGVTFDANATGSARVTISPEGEVRYAISDGAGRGVMSGMLKPSDSSLLSWNCSVHDETTTISGFGTVLVSKSVNALGKVSQQYSDGAGRTIQSLDALGKITSYEYDAAGNQLKVRDPNGVGQDCTYDALGRDLSCTDTSSAVVSSSYDAAGNKIASTDAKSETTTYTFDARGRQVKQTDRLGGETEFAYSATGNLLSLTDAEDQVTSYTYDDAGTKLTETYPDHVPSSTPGQAGYGIVSFTPDATGRTKVRADQQGDTCTYAYDLAGRLLNKVYAANASGPLTGQGHTDTFTYDDDSRMLSAVSGRYSNTVTYTYDDAGRKATEALTFGGQTYTTTTDYDLAGQVSGYTYPDGTAVGRTYTDRGQLATLSYASTTVDTRTYDDGGRMTGSAYNNGVSEARTYNTDNTLASITHSGAAVGNYTYGWDANKNKTSEAISGTLSGYGFAVGTSGYDDEDRLVNWERSDNNLDQAWNLSLVGDWNSFTQNASTQARAHGPTHEMLTVASQAVTHDTKGNTTSIPAVLRPGTDPLAMKWDFENKLIGADIDNDATDDVTYQWDALLRRVGRDDGTTASVYVQNGQQTVADYTSGTAASSPTYTYVYASYIDEPVLRGGTGGLRYYHRGQQYSITALTNASGTVVERYAYDAYGTPTITDAGGTTLTTSAENNRYTYTGREYDEVLGLYHYRARMYDSASGRFCSRDPIGYYGSKDGLYDYVEANPLSRSDPSGMIPCLQKNTVTVGLDDLTIHKEKANQWFGCTSLPANAAGAAWLVDLVASALGKPTSVTKTVGPSPCPCNLSCKTVWKNQFSFSTPWIGPFTRTIKADVEIKGVPVGPQINCDITFSVKLKIDTDIEIGACQ